MHFAGTHAQGLAGNVHELFHDNVRFAGIQPVGENYTRDASHKLLLLLPHGGARNVDSHIPATNNHHSFSNGKAVTQIDVEKKINALNDAIELMPGKIEVPAAVQAKR